ncbi:GLPGLI family protein [Pedobacter alpinus]|uniref:GLPGLI family protein n=1 Tax=Pedobacter alpinus TaxID=1590643 RepID=A0ABW5TMA7_9SPHI
MKNKTIYLIFTLLPTLLYSQSKDSVLAIASYKLTHQYDTSGIGKVNVEVFDLFMSKHSSHYKSHEISIQDSIMKSEYNKSKIMMPPINRRASDEEVFTFTSNKQQFVKVSRIMGDYVVQRSYPNINWKILPDIKVILGLKCQKATGNFHGREYVVWFSKDTPFKLGPWKLNGLPGLIVNAEDITGNIKFELIELKNNSITSNQQIFWSKKSQLIEWEEFKRLAKAIEDDPLGFAERKFGGKITTTSKNAPTNHINIMLPRKSINFPLEAFDFYTIR